MVKLGIFRFLWLIQKKFERCLATNFTITVQYQISRRNQFSRPGLGTRRQTDTANKLTPSPGFPTGKLSPRSYVCLYHWRCTT